MSLAEEIAARIEFFGIDGGVASDLQAARAALEPEFGALLDAFYARILKRPELKALFGDEEVIARARAAQEKHWLEALFSGRYDASFVDKAERIGAAHARIGLNLSWYLGGYCLMLAQFIDVLGKQAPHLAARQIQAVIKAVFLDVDLVADAYLEAKNRDMRAILRRVTELSEDMRALSVGLRLSVQSARAAAEPPLSETASAESPESGEAARDLRRELGRVEEQAEQMADRLAQLQLVDRLHIDDEAPGTGTFSRLRGLLLGD
jgi:hypothetical protein